MREELEGLVKNERLRRGWSTRQAGAAGGCSHTYWDDIEKGRARKPVMVRSVVAQAFGWPDDWVENPPPTPEVTQRDDEVLAAFRQWGETMLATMQTMQQQIGELQQAVDQLRSEGRPTPPARRRSS